MGKKSHEEKSRQLGEAITTASHRLSRMVMFNLFRRLGEDICIRCGKQIERFEEFSLDHRKPWLHVSPELFWNLENIGAAHKKCNSGARRSRPRKKIGREKWRNDFAKLYSDPVKRDRWNARRRELYASRNSALSSTVGLG